MKNNKKKITIHITLLIVIACLIVGYALLSTTLSINGDSSIKGNTWDVHFANVHIKDGSTTGNTKEATITNPTLVEFNINLDKPGDYYEFTVDVVNAGTIDAMIESIDSKLNGTTITTLPAYLNYSVTYSNGTPIEQNHQLIHNTSEKYKVRIEYNRDINANQLPTSNQTLNLELTVTYTQADENATEVDHSIYLYRFNNNEVHIGNNISSLGTYYTSAEEVMSISGRPFFLRNSINNNQVEINAIGFSRNGHIYYLLGKKLSNTGVGYGSNPYYESNKIALNNIFGSENCSETQNGGMPIYSCGRAIENGNPGIWLNAYTNAFGDTGLTDLDYYCDIYSDGTSICGYGAGSCG